MSDDLSVREKANAVLRNICDPAVLEAVQTMMANGNNMGQNYERNRSNGQSDERQSNESQFGQRKNDSQQQYYQTKNQEPQKQGNNNHRKSSNGQSDVRNESAGQFSQRNNNTQQQYYQTKNQEPQKQGNNPHRKSDDLRGKEVNAEKNKIFNNNKKRKGGGVNNLAKRKVILNRSMQVCILDRPDTLTLPKGQFFSELDERQHIIRDIDFSSDMSEEQVVKHIIYSFPKEVFGSHENVRFSFLRKNGKVLTPVTLKTGGTMTGSALHKNYTDKAFIFVAPSVVLYQSEHNPPNEKEEIDLTGSEIEEETLFEQEGKEEEGEEEKGKEDEGKEEQDYFGVFNDPDGHDYYFNNSMEEDW